ncbi:hypothetical protein LCGC14_0915790 [marine sediment metagenome]|uniref:Uncharacterized protein n=1 Tax=marine sediment metagenome TaxID=412755 RepID=A0A0F9PD36_9ZZZZ
MTIDEAIGILTNYVNHLPKGVNEDWIKANKLLIEAGKRELEYRESMPPRNGELLPGETKE